MSIPEGLSILPHDPHSEAHLILHSAVADAAKKGAPDDTLVEAMKMIREDCGEFDLQRFYQNQGECEEPEENKHLSEGDIIDGMRIISVVKMDDVLRLFSGAGKIRLGKAGKKEVSPPQ